MVENTESIGARIATARESNRMTQQDLASASGVERSALAKIERGLRGIGALELASLARALDVRLEWLLSDGPATIASHRTRSDVGVELSTIDKELERIARDVEFINSLDPNVVGAGLTPLGAPGTASEAEQLSIEARSRCGLDATAPVHDLVGRIAGVGLLAFSMPLGTETADAAITLLDRGGVALVNSTSLVGRRRLAVAHEFGHYLVSDDYTIDWRVAEHGDSDRTESLLDRFARSFLAPEAGLIRFWSDARRDHDLRTAAVLTTSHFRIDMSTLARRLSELELATSGECATIRVVKTTRADIIEYGLSIPYDLEAVSLPRTYEKAVLALYRAERISGGRALTLLRGTLGAEDLPDLRTTHPSEIWSVLS